MSKKGLSYRFCDAVVRRPGRSVVAGLRSTDRGAPDFERFRVGHGEYVEALQGAGVRVTVLDALEVFPDSVFVGLSERTDQQGFEWLQSILEAWGYRVRSVRTPAGALHLKSDCCVLGGDTALATRRLAAPANRVRCPERIPGQVRPSS